MKKIIGLVAALGLTASFLQMKIQDVDLVL